MAISYCFQTKRDVEKYSYSDAFSIWARVMFYEVGSSYHSSPSSIRVKGNNLNHLFCYDSCEHGEEVL